MKLPFCLTLKNYLLDGMDRDIAKSRHEKNQMEHEYDVLDIKFRYGELDDESYTIKKSNLDLKYNIITKNQHTRMMLPYIKDIKERRIAELDIDLLENKISQQAHDKEIATLKNEPWVSVLSMETDPTDVSVGAVSLDWNDIFVSQLREHGYPGETDDAVVNVWFVEMCRNIAMETYDGVGEFTEVSEDNVSRLKGEY